MGKTLIYACQQRTFPKALFHFLSSAYISTACLKHLFSSCCSLSEEAKCCSDFKRFSCRMKLNLSESESHSSSENLMKFMVSL